MLRKALLGMIFIFLLFIFPAGCQMPDREETDDTAINKESENESLKPEDQQENLIPPENNGEKNVSAKQQAKEVKANELGQVMILMYHDIGEPEGEWRRTPENFLQDLEVLYQEGFRPVALNNFLDGNIDIPAGTSPVIITFDDGHQGQFNYLTDPQGKLLLDPDSAVAIMMSFADKFSDFKPSATFYVYYPVPFRQKELIEEKFKFLVEAGMEIGNHTYSHANLRSITDAEVIKELALHQAETEKYLPGYRVRSLALPYGAYPQNEEILYRGSYEDVSFQVEAVLLVGANPAPSPFHQNFNPFRLPRIRASEKNTEGVGLYDWLEYFKDNPENRYISDGDPNTVALNADKLDNLNKDAVGDRELVVYD